MQTISTNNAGNLYYWGISSYQWWSEALHGLLGPGISLPSGDINGLTLFPQVIGTSSAFNRTLFKLIGDAISSEARAMNNNKQGDLTFWSPNINIFRDPRWGRGQETPGEDPFLTGEYGINYVLGMEGNDSKYLKSSACIKHFGAYSMENSDNKTRFNFNAIVSSYDLNDTYFPAFKNSIIGSNVSGVMCSYVSINGVPSCGNKWLLTDILRDEWGFNGYIVSDCSAVDEMLIGHNYTNNGFETNSVAYKAGLDLQCGFFPIVNYSLIESIDLGYVNINDVKRAMYNIIMIQMRLGFYDDSSLLPNEWTNYGPETVCSYKHLNLSLEASRQSIVLLKNLDDFLPINPGMYSIVSILGPNANSGNALKGDYAAQPCFSITVYEGLQMYYNKSNILYEKGCDIDSNDTSNIPSAVNASINSNLTILVMGLDTSIEREFHDRTDLLLPGEQDLLIESVVNATNHPIILIILSGGCVDISKWQNNKNINAIVWGGYPGMFGGQAINEIIFTDGIISPSGLLTQTWYKNEFINEVKMIDMNMRYNGTTNPGRGYRYYTGDSVLYPFGYGLYYTKFTCNNFVYSSVNNTVSMSVKNSGNTQSNGIVLVYWIPDNNGNKYNGLPLKRLVAFESFSELYPNDQIILIMNLYNEFVLHNEIQYGGKWTTEGVCQN